MEIETAVSISQFIELINAQLELLETKIIGEITELKSYASGKFFTLKDKETSAVMPCVIWNRTYDLMGITLENGMEVILSGHASIYAAWGKLQFYADSVELVGEGALKKAYEKLKQKLIDEGVFARERKRAFPLLPTKIGVITSKRGAVIHDFLSNLSKHGMQITLIDSKVEGQEALPALYKAIKTMRNQQIDLLVIMRGGGSLQSLAAFDNEALVREIVSFPVPVLAAIGHHQDVPLVALAADHTVSTPTAAANKISESWQKALYDLDRFESKIISKYTQNLSDLSLTLSLKFQEINTRFDRIIAIFTYTSKKLPEYIGKVAGQLIVSQNVLTGLTSHITSHMVDDLAVRSADLSLMWNSHMIKPFQYLMTITHTQIDTKEKLINIHNPKRLLRLGYSLIRNRNGQLVKSTKHVTIGDTIALIFSDGNAKADITQIDHTNE